MTNAILDLSNAFYTVPHDGLLHKLEAYEVRGPLHERLTTFLTNRNMCVAPKGEFFCEVRVDSGGPQGRVLRQQFNELPDPVKSTVKLFAEIFPDRQDFLSSGRDIRRPGIKIRTIETYARRSMVQ